MSVNYEKFSNAVLYLLSACPQKPGVVALVKMLFFCDYDHYRRNLRSITEARYLAMKMGPVVEDYATLFTRMEAEGLVAQQRVHVGAVQEKHEFTGLSKPNLDVFSDSEMDSLRRVVVELGSMTGRSLVQKAHSEGPWQMVWDEQRPNRAIPYSLFTWLDNLPVDGDLDSALADISQPDVAREIAQLNAA